MAKSKQANADIQAQVVLSSVDLQADMDFFSGLGFRLENIFPSDDPAVAIMDGHKMSIRLDKQSKSTSTTIHLLIDDPSKLGNGKTELKAPNGTLVKIVPRTFQLEIPETRHTFEVRQLKDNDSWVIGRAGMLYRDLITDRLGGSIIASHINIPDGGPVPDMVHYHTIGFQLIFCYKGWVKLVYEDQGPPFILEAGDCVTQPPEIRHKVLEASDNLEVIEIGVPADHMTTVDHDMKLPTEKFRAEREFKGQKFRHHIAKNVLWRPWRIPGFEFRKTGIKKATRKLASVHVARKIPNEKQESTISHSADILFTFVMKGTVELNVEDHDSSLLKSSDAFVIPPHLKYRLANCSDDLELLQVALPGKFQTIIH